MLRILKKFGVLFDKRQKRRIVLLFIMMLVGAVLEIVGVSLMIPLMTAIMQPDIIESNAMVKWACELLGIGSHRTFVLVCIVALIVVFIVKDLYLMLQYYAQNSFVFNNRFSTQKRLLRAFMHRPYEYYLNSQTGEILRIIQNDVVQSYTLLMSLLGFLTETIVSSALVATIFVIDPYMTAFVAVMMLGIIVVIHKVVKPILRREGIAFQHQLSTANKWILQAISGIKVVKVNGRESFFEDKYHESGLQMIRNGKLTSVLNHFPRILIEMVSVCSMLALIAIMIVLGRDMESLLPSIGAFAMAALKLMPSANRIVMAMNAISYQEPALDQMLENINILDETEAPSNRIRSDSKATSAVASAETESAAGNSQNKLTLEKEILLQNITYHYPDSEKYILDDAQMVIPVGKSVGIVGTSGVGKTTAVDIMLGLLIPQKGQILADGVDVMDSYDEWLSHIGYIPQTIFMLDDTIRANVAFGVKPGEQSDEQVWNALEEAQLAEFVRSLPAGLDARIGEHGVRVSGGQRQRIGIARALYNNPELLVFDEATSSLDNETEAAIMESINSLHGKKTMVIIAHRLQTIEGCDIVYRVSDGKIVKE